MRARLLLLCLTLSACDVGAGKGALNGNLYVQACTLDSNYGTLLAPRAYEMNPIFFVGTPVDDFNRPYPMNRLSIRMQPAGNRVEEADVMILMVNNDRDVAVGLNQDLPVGASTNVRATLNLQQLCPDAEVEIELDGTINWSHFGSANPPLVPQNFRIEFEDRLTASFQFDVVDRRAIVLGGLGGVSPVPTLGGHLTGFFDFVVRQGRAAQSP